MRKAKLPNWIWLVASSLGVVALGMGVFVYFFPLQYAEMSNRFELWREGVTEIHSGGLHGYAQERCRKGAQARGAQAGKECTCVALVHGLADNAMTWKKILIWPENGWPDPVNLYAFDLPGSGGTPVPERPAQDYRVRKQAQALKLALAPLCQRWMVVGNSLGGWVAAWLALDWPEAVNRLILLDSAGLKGAASSEDLQGFLNPTVESLKEFQRRAYYRGRPLPERVWQAAVERMKLSNARQVIEAQTPEDYLDGRIGALRRPVLLQWGQADQVTPVSEGKQFKALMPGAVWREVPECGHLPQKECPLEVIKSIVNMIGFGAA